MTTLAGGLEKTERMAKKMEKQKKLCSMFNISSVPPKELLMRELVAKKILES